MPPLPKCTPDLAVLELLVLVAELGSLGRAAEQHQISQPSASVRIARLERQVGRPLLIRGFRGSQLTPTGEAVVAWARPVLDAARVLGDGIASLRRDQTARLRVAASLTIAEYLMPGWMLLLRRTHPDLQTAVEVLNSHGVADHVRANTVDIGFIESPTAPAGLHAAQVGTDRISLVVAPGYPLAARSHKALPPRDVLEHPLLLREPGSGTRDTFLTALGINGDGPTMPAHTVELGSTAIIVATALAGGGIGVVSARAVATEVAHHRLVELALTGINLQRPLHAIWAGDQPTPLAAELITFARAAHRTEPAGPANPQRSRGQVR